MISKPRRRNGNPVRKTLLPVAGLALAVCFGLVETVALGLARWRSTRYR
jgi:hypothetical protein